MVHEHINPNRLTDSAGVPWEGRQLQPNPHAGDDGSADPGLLQALGNFRDQLVTSENVIEALKTARLLLPLVASLGEAGEGANGLVVDKSADLSIVSVASPDGQVALPVFTSVQTMLAWDSKARPVPIEAARVALAAASEKNGRIILDAGSPTEFAIRQTAFRAIAEGGVWLHPARNPEVKSAFAKIIDGEPAIENFAIQDGDAGAKLAGPEVLVYLKLAPRLDQSQLNSIAQRLSAAWAESSIIAQCVDSIGLRLV